jgi:hypothetical protein
MDDLRAILEMVPRNGPEPDPHLREVIMGSLKRKLKRKPKRKAKRVVRRRRKPQIGIGSFPNGEIRILASLAVAAGIFPPDAPPVGAYEELQDDIRGLERVCKPAGKSGNARLSLPQARKALKFLALRAGGMRTGEALSASQLKSRVPIYTYCLCNKAFRAMYEAAIMRRM